MKTETHTVTIPVADYNELLSAQAGQCARFEELKNSVVNVLVSSTQLRRGQSLYDSIDQLIREIKLVK